jgi:Concanavalin A-like lectin/glucanases superfamily
MKRILIGASLLAIVLPGCGGGGGARTMLPTVSPATSSTNSPVAASSSAGVALTVTIPAGPTTNSTQRRPQYISSATNSISFMPQGGSTTVVSLAAGAPNCVTGSTGSRICSVNVSAPTGPSITFTISAFASTDGTGTPLSTVTTSQAIVANTLNPINVTLNAVVSKLQVALSPSAFTLGVVASSILTVTALDASGKIIAVGTNQLVDGNNNPVTITLSDSESAATKLSATTFGTSPVSLNYAGGTPSAASATITATLSSGGTATAPFTFAAAGTSTPTPVATTPPATSSYISAVAADKPLAYYRMNESAGTVMTDSSGNGKNGGYTGGYKLAQPALLIGDSAAKSVAFPTGYATGQATWTAQAVTAECWIKPTAADIAGTPRIISNAWTDHSGNGFMVWLTSGTVGFNTGWVSDVGTSPLVAGQTYHVVGTYDNTTGTTLYLNGIAVSNKTGGAVPVPQTGDFNGATYIGVLNATAGGFGMVQNFQGSISDCAIYDHALTPARVAAHYNAGAQANITPVPIPTVAPTAAPPTQTPPPGPISYNSGTACINHVTYTNNVLPSGEGEFATNGLDRSWWGRTRGNTLGGNQYSGFQTSWGRNQYDTYFGDSSDGLPGGHDPFYVGPDTGAPGSPQGVRISAFPMPADLVGNAAVHGASYYSGVLDTPINQQYGFFVARVRVPAPAPGMSPAFWMLSNNGMPQGPHGPLNGEWDIQEMFGNTSGTGMNAGNIQWNSASSSDQNWGGVFNWPTTEASSPSSDYHDFGALLSPGGATISSNDYGSGGPGLVYGPANQGVTNYLDGVPLYGHTGGADLTQGVSWKELMAMFQVGASGGWLGSPNTAQFPASFWVQWIRVYRPTTTPC